MASVSEAIQALDPNCQFVLRGEPTDAISFNAAFSLVVGVDRMVQLYYLMTQMIGKGQE